MLSAASKIYLAIAGFAAVAWLVFGHFAHRADHFGITALVALATAATAGAWAASLRVVGDTDIERPVTDDASPLALAPPAPPGRSTRPSIFPFLAAAGIGAIAIAPAYGKLATIAGVALLAMGAGGWLGQTIQEHPTYTSRFGDRVEGRVVGPFGYPVLAIAFGAALVISVSRLYLSVSENAAIVVSGVFAAALFLICLVAANGADIGRRLTGALGALAAVAVVSSGVVGAAQGERTIEKHPLSFTRIRVEAEGIQYGRGDHKLEKLALPEGTIRLTFANFDPEGTYHDIGIYSEKVGGEPLVAALPIDGGKKGVSDINTTKAGMYKGTTYFFRCDFHPAMVGQVEIVDGPKIIEGEHK